MKKIVTTIIACITLLMAEQGLADSVQPTPSSSLDPLESINRPIFAFNQGFDKVFMTPVSKGYNAIIPKPIRTGANNFFENIAMISTTGNDILQGEFKQTILDVWRFLINSTFGLAGTIDVAAEFGIPKHFNDMGITFAKWGYKDSTYLIIPFLGSTTIRDGAGLVADYYLLSPYPYLDRNTTIYAILAYRFLTIKAQLVEANQFVNDVALDPYTFTRDAYYQYRNNKINENVDNSQYMYLEENEPQDLKPGEGYVPDTDTAVEVSISPSAAVQNSKK